MKRKSLNQKTSASPKKKPNIEAKSIEKSKNEPKITSSQSQPIGKKKRNRKNNKNKNKVPEKTVETSDVANVVAQSNKAKNKSKQVVKKVEEKTTDTDSDDEEEAVDEENEEEKVEEENEEEEEEEVDEENEEEVEDENEEEEEEAEEKTDDVTSSTKADDDSTEENDDKTAPKKVTKQPAVKKIIRYVLFVGNLSYNITKQEIQEHFQKVGTIKDIRIPLEKKGNKQKGYAFIEVSNAQEYEKTLSLNGTFINGRKINVLYSTGKGGGKNKPDKHGKKKLLKMEGMRKKGMITGFKGRDNNRKRNNQRNKKKNNSNAPTDTT